MWTTKPMGVLVYMPTDANPYYRLKWYTDKGKVKYGTASRDPDKAWAKACHIDEMLQKAGGKMDDRTFREMYTAWLREVGPNWSPRHATDQLHYCLTYLKTGFGELNASTLTREDVRDMLQTPTSASCRRKLRALLGGLLRWGYDNNWLLRTREQLLPAAPRTSRSSAGLAHGVSRLHIGTELVPSPAACGALADAMRAQGGERYGQQYWLMVAVAASTGLRQAELFALRKRDLNLDDGKLEVNSQLIRVKSLLPMETAPKWGRTRTTVLPELTLWREPLREPLAAYLADKADDELVFTNSRGGFIHASNFDSRVLKPARAAAAAGGWAAGWAWHSLRHAFASRALSSDGKTAAQDVDVSMALGHRDTVTTRAMYVSSTEGGLGRLNDVFA